MGKCAALKNFPNKIDHTLQWARDWFEGEMRQVCQRFLKDNEVSNKSSFCVQIPEAVNAYLTQTDFLEQLAKQQNIRIDTLEKVIMDCVITAALGSLIRCRCMLRWLRTGPSPLLIAWHGRAAALMTSSHTPSASCFITFP
jgi:hypothetical protein